MNNDQDNPYITALPEVQSIVENAEEQRILVTDADGTSYLISRTQELIILNPGTGERQFLKTQQLIRTQDGRIILNPGKEPLYACNNCNRKLLTQQSIKFCQSCQTTECLNCIRTIQDPNGQPIYLCQTCFKNSRMKRIIQWIFTIRP